jgi:hypothetical protein
MAGSAVVVGADPDMETIRVGDSHPLAVTAVAGRWHHQKARNGDGAPDKHPSWPEAGPG